MSEEPRTLVEYQFSPQRLIEEVKKRPGLYECGRVSDRVERLQLWKEVGAALYPKWGTLNKATMYHTVMQIQRKWRSLRDAYNRELRARRSRNKGNRRVYIYFKRMSFLGGFDGLASGEDEHVDTATEYRTVELDPLVNGNTTKSNKKKGKSSTEGSPEEVEMPVFSNVEIPNDIEADTDRLFLLSFLPEMRQLPVNIKMWTRTQIARVMQEAVSSHFNNTQPVSIELGRSVDVKRQGRDSSD